MKLSNEFLLEKQSTFAASIAMGIFFCAAIAATTVAFSLDDGEDHSRYVNQALNFSSYAFVLWLWKRQIIKSNILIDYVDMLADEVGYWKTRTMTTGGSGVYHRETEENRSPQDREA